MKICVIGLGYIGLPTAAMFASKGHQVVGVDKNECIVSALNQGEIIIEEDYLADFVKDAVAKGDLCGSLVPQEADAFIIAVPTPITADKKADMRFVQAAAEEITPFLRKGNLVILESTSPIGTVDELICPIIANSGLKIGSELFVGHSPERVIPGKILYELVHNSRIAGGINQASAEKIAELYRCFVEGDIYLTNARTAELCKLAENTFRDINIAYANELALICEKSGINVWEAINLCNNHPRVNIHQPGPGVGGHCIAVDPWFIVEKQPQTAQLIHQARLINDRMPEIVAQKIIDMVQDKDKPQVTILGVTYKPNVDDTRESPILTLISQLAKTNIQVLAQDPFAANYQGDIYQAATGSDLVVLGVDHNCYRELDLARLAQVMRTPKLLDTRNFFSRETAEATGLEYHLLGDK